MLTCRKVWSVVRKLWACVMTSTVANIINEVILQGILFYSERRNVQGWFLPLSLFFFSFFLSISIYPSNYLLLSLFRSVNPFLSVLSLYLSIYPYIYLSIFFWFCFFLFFKLRLSWYSWIYIMHVKLSAYQQHMHMQTVVILFYIFIPWHLHEITMTCL